MSHVAGWFITLEGGEGVGKSTLAGLLADALRELFRSNPKLASRAVVTTREPGGTAAAEAIRKLMLNPPPGVTFAGEVQALLAYSARQSHLDELIRPALVRGDWVVCDRFIDSSWAYQHYAGSAPAHLLRSLDSSVVGETRPDITFLLTAASTTRNMRRSQRAGQSRADSFERLPDEFHDRVCEGFIERAREEPNRFVVLETDRVAASTLARQAASIAIERFLQS